jgi:hypothetical protein
MGIRIFAIWLVVSCAFSAVAHRLDEYLQATRIAVDADRLDFEFDLTPGVAVASRVIALIDTDGDGRISAAEGRAYASKFLAGAKLKLDGGEMTLRLLGVTMPSKGAMEAGLGMIRIKAAARISGLKPGPHQIRFENSHQPGMSVYLVNALLPSDPAIRITKQSRDELQRNYAADFDYATRPGTETAR